VLDEQVGAVARHGRWPSVFGGEKALERAGSTQNKKAGGISQISENNASCYTASLHTPQLRMTQTKPAQMATILRAFAIIFLFFASSAHLTTTASSTFAFPTCPAKCPTANTTMNLLNKNDALSLAKVRKTAFCNTMPFCFR